VGNWEKPTARLVLVGHWSVVTGGWRKDVGEWVQKSKNHWHVEMHDDKPRVSRDFEMLLNMPLQYKPVIAHCNGPQKGPCTSDTKAISMSVIHCLTMLISLSHFQELCFSHPTESCLLYIHVHLPITVIQPCLLTASLPLSSLLSFLHINHILTEHSGTYK
jgi:hypothetical protein